MVRTTPKVPLVSLIVRASLFYNNQLHRTFLFLNSSVLKMNYRNANSASLWVKGVSKLPVSLVPRPLPSQDPLSPPPHQVCDSPTPPECEVDSREGRWAPHSCSHPGWCSPPAQPHSHCGHKSHSPDPGDPPALACCLASPRILLHRKRQKWLKRI